MTKVAAGFTGTFLKHIGNTFRSVWNMSPRVPWAQTRGPLGPKIKDQMGPKFSGTYRETTGPNFMTREPYESPLALDAQYPTIFPCGPWMWWWVGASNGPMELKSCLWFDICEQIPGWFARLKYIDAIWCHSFLDLISPWLLAYNVHIFCWFNYAAELVTPLVTTWLANIIKTRVYAGVV